MYNLKSPPPFKYRRSRSSLNDDPSLCDTPFTLLVVLASFTSGDQHFCEIDQDWGRAKTAGNRFARDDKEPAPAGGNSYTENGIVKPPRRDTRALSPAGMFGRKKPLRLAAQKSLFKRHLGVFWLLSSTLVRVRQRPY
jgi:hypothetical protein